MFSAPAQALDMKSRLLLRVALNDDISGSWSWPWMQDLEHWDGFTGDANWFFNGQLVYPSIKEGVPVKLQISYSWMDRQAIPCLCFLGEHILGIFK